VIEVALHAGLKVRGQLVADNTQVEKLLVGIDVPSRRLRRIFDDESVHALGREFGTCGKRVQLDPLELLLRFLLGCAFFAIIPLRSICSFQSLWPARAYRQAQCDLTSPTVVSIY
jgi:hypothetical protein